MPTSGHVDAGVRESIKAISAYNKIAGVISEEEPGIKKYCNLRVKARWGAGRSDVGVFLAPSKHALSALNTLGASIMSTRTPG